MNEKLLQYIWAQQYFNSSCLITAEGFSVQVIFPGILNPDQGPDFFSARLRIGGQDWAGNVELHVKTSDWSLHGHDADPNYGNVILHVVWLHDIPWNSRIPLLELQPLVPGILLSRYHQLMGNHRFIPCEREFSKYVRDGGSRNMVYAWFEFLSSRRMSVRSAGVLEKLRGNRMDWEETFWQAIARNFGHRVNADAFEHIARTVPLKLMIRHSGSIQQLEALLMGQAGLIRTDNPDDYPKMLNREYNFLRRKYALQRSPLPVHFLRMRPGNFPTIRLAQLAALVKTHRQLFSRLRGMASLEELMAFFRVAANDYWHYHYRFGEMSAYREKVTGHQLIGNIIINTVIPFFRAWELHGDYPGFIEKTNRWLRKTEPEINSIINGYGRLGMVARHGSDTQGMLECWSNYCEKKRCLDCAIGKFAMRRTMLRTS